MIIPIIVIIMVIARTIIVIIVNIRERPLPDWMTF